MAKKLLVGGALLVGVAIAVVLFIDFDSPELGKMLSDRASEATGAELEVERFRLNLVRGLRLENVEASIRLPGGRLEAHLDELVFEHRILPLLSGRVAVQRILILGPRVEIIEKSRSKSSAPKGKKTRTIPKSESSLEAEGESEVTTGAVGGLELAVSEVGLEGGSILIHQEGEEEGSTRLTGLDVRLRNISFDPKAISPVHALTGEGGLELQELFLNSIHVRDARGQLRLGQGKLEGDDFTFTTEQGKFHASLQIDFNRVPFTYTLSLRGDPLDVNAIAGSGKEGGFGPGLLELEAEGFGTDSKGIKGEGLLNLAEGKLPSTPILAGIENALDRKTALVGAPYKATDAPFRIEKNQLILERFQLETPQAAVDLSGVVHLDGRLALKLAVRTPRQGLVIKEVPNEVLDALTDDEGWVVIPFKVTGSREKPHVTLDSRTLMAQARKGGTKLLQDRATKGITDFLRKKLN